SVPPSIEICSWEVSFHFADAATIDHFANRMKVLLSARYLGLRGQSAHWVAERPTLRKGYHRNDAARNRARSMYSASALCGVGGSIRSKCRCHALDSRIIHYGIPAVAGMSYEEHVMSMNKDQLTNQFVSIFTSQAA